MCGEVMDECRKGIVCLFVCLLVCLFLSFSFFLSCCLFFFLSLILYIFLLISLCLKVMATTSGLINAAFKKSKPGAMPAAETVTTNADLPETIEWYKKHTVMLILWDSTR